MYVQIVVIKFLDELTQILLYVNNIDYLVCIVLLE